MARIHKGARIGVAAFALGLSLAGPQGLAAADVGDDASNVPSHPRTEVKSPAARAARAAARDHVDVGQPRQRSSRIARPSAVDARPAATKVPAESSTEAPAVVPASVVALSPRRSTQTAPPAAAFTTSLPGAAPEPTALLAARASTMAQASALDTPRLTRIVDRIGHWLAGLPAGPVNDLLSGALLIVRRALLPAPAAASNQPTLHSESGGSGPVLTGITSTPGSKTIVLTFDGPLIPDTATDLANYRVNAVGWRNPELVTSSGPALRVLGAQYADVSESSSQVTLTLARGLRQGTFYRIFINGELPITNGNPNSNPLTGTNAVTFDGDNDETAGGNFYGLLGVGKRLSFRDFSGDRVMLSATGGGSLNVWRELNGDIDQLTVLPGATGLSGSVIPGMESTGKVYIGSVTIPVPSPLNLNGATNNLPQSFHTVPKRGLTPPPPEPTQTSPDPIVATSQNLPYTLNISPVSAPGIKDLPGIQSGVYAQTAPTKAYPSGLWVVFGGRTNGLHGFDTSGEQSFPPSFQNGVVYVINPVDWQVWSRPWNQTDVPVAVYNSLSSTNQQHYQKGDTLYTVGGYSVPGTLSFTGDVRTSGNSILVTSGVENLIVGQTVSGVVPFPSGQEIFPSGTTITAIDGSTVTTSNGSETDASGVTFAAYTSDFTTYDALTALSVQGLADAVINGGDVAKLADIRQISDPRLGVTGGELELLNGRTYLAFGQNFQGGYNGQTADISQVYTDEIRSFRIIDNGRRLAIVGYRALRDPVNYRRRDGNIVNFVGTAGQAELAYLGGVFTPGAAGIGYQAPILIGPGGRARIDAAYQQFFSQYSTANIPLFDGRSRSMYDLLLGGISLYSYADGTLKEDPLLPFVDNVTSLVRSRDGSFQEYMMPPIPTVTKGGTGYYGAQAGFFANEALPTYGNDVIRLSQLSGPTVLGYLYAGIYSTKANPFNTFSATGASNQVFQITLTPS